MTAAEIVALLNLERHPEGGWYRQTFIVPSPAAAHIPPSSISCSARRPLALARVDPAEVWHGARRRALEHRPRGHPSE